MSDLTPDPMDKAYAEAETLLADDAARAARRARVLAAVAADAQAPAESARPKPRAWPGWLAAAGVGGVSVFIATQIYRPATIDRPPAAPPISTAPPASVPEPAAALAAPRGEPLAAERRVAQVPPAQAKAAPATAARDAAPALAAPAAAPAPPPPPPPPQAFELEETVLPPTTPRAAARRAAPSQALGGLRAAPSADAAAPVTGRVEELVVTGSKRAPSDADARRAERLRQAAAEGDSREIARLLAAGVPIDAAASDGATALMKAIEAREIAAAALLRRRGADLDLRNAEGRSARDMARDLADPDLDRALGLKR